MDPMAFGDVLLSVNIGYRPFLDWRIGDPESTQIHGAAMAAGVNSGRFHARPCAVIAMDHHRLHAFR